MKRIITYLIALLLVFAAMTVCVFAKETLPTVQENEFTVASFNGTKIFTLEEKTDITLEDSTFWLLNNKDALNLKYVSFLGPISGGANYTYYNYSKVMAELKTANSEDVEWQKEFNVVRRSMNFLRDEGISTGITYLYSDYYASGFMRDSNQAALFPVSEIVTDNATYDYYNDANYYIIIENNGQKYIVFQLELWPRTAVINWFNTTIAQHKDKYAIVFTGSMIDATGEMYTMWDWQETGGKIVTQGFSSPLRSHNIANYDQPCDGTVLWKYCFSQHDNILAIFSSYVDKQEEIVMSKVTNVNGIETALIAANIAFSGIDKKYGPVPLISVFSEDNKTITSHYAVPFSDILKTNTITLNKIGTLEESKTNDSLPHVEFQYNGANKAYIFGYEGNLFKPNNNMTRAEACTIFARLILGVQDIPAGYTTRFTDVSEGAWYYNAIAYLDQTGFFFRNKNTTYKPNEPITRAEFVDLANAASSLKKGDKEISFKDVPADHFYYDSIIAAAGAGLVNGYEDETFRPDNTITRAEVVTVINRLLGLKVSATTIATDKLENVFNDIGSHWAKLNVLMASNSNVHGDYYYEKTLDGVTETSSAYTFENDTMAFTVAKKNGKVTKILNKYNGEDINLPASNYQFIYLIGANGANSAPVAMETEGNRIKVTFRNGSVVYMLVEITNNYMTFEIDSELVSGEQQIVFGNLQTNIKIDDNDDESFRICIVGMTAWTNPAQKGYGYHTAINASAFPNCPSGAMGAKIGITFAKKGVAIDYLKEILQAIDPAVGITGTTGAAYTKDYAPLSGDYWLITNVSEETIDDIIEVCKTYGIDQADIHKGSNTHRPGDFWFYNTETGTATEFYEKYGKKFEEAGIMTGLHTYAYYIDYSASGILSDPKWQKDLETLEEYTLRKKMTKFTKNAATVEDASKFDLTYEFFYKNSRYVLIDQEIIRVGNGTSSGLINCTRGCGGTTPAEHAAGTKIYHLSGYFQLFVPKLGSDLFYHVADLTAKAYNEGGFGMIYLDAIDGLNRHTDDYVWYYFQMFVQRITSQCKVSPILETSSGGPQEWNIRGRVGAYDVPSRGYNMFNAGHITNNKINMRHNFIATVGWYDFYPDRTSTYKNTITRTQFKNNFDYLGFQSIIYNMTMVYNGLATSTLESSPFLRANLDYYNEFYSKLRKSNYFTEETINAVKENGGEFKVIKKAEGEYAFLEMYYNNGKLGKRGTDDYTFKGNNPFTTQSPFIRIENLFSTLGEDPVTLVKYDEEKALSEQKLTTNLTPVNISGKCAITLRVKGTNTDGDAMLISLMGKVGHGRLDYFVDLNFDGWKDVILTTVDNGEYDRNKYSFAGITLDGGNFTSFVSGASIDDLSLVEIRLSGKTANTAHIGNISACTIVDAPIKNPSVKIGTETVTFNTTLKSGDYVEYAPETKTATLYHAYEQTTETVSVSGGLNNVAKGTFTAEFSAEAQTAAVTKANVVIGFSGVEITNK